MLAGIRRMDAWHTRLKLLELGWLTSGELGMFARFTRKMLAGWHAKNGCGSTSLSLAKASLSQLEMNRWGLSQKVVTLSG